MTSMGRLWAVAEDAEAVFCFWENVVLDTDTGFCVLKAILASKTVGGLFADALIKKRRYWPVLVPGPAMDERFAAKAVGEVEAIQGLDVASNTPYFFWCMKESDYVTRIMATGGSLSTDATCKTAHCGVGANRVSFP
jgi:hypothetical protein